MLFKEFFHQRKEELLKEKRVHGGDDPSNPGLNHLSGLVDLIHYCKPKSVVEIGSNRGLSTEMFLLHCQRVVAIDPWEDRNVHTEFLERCGFYPNLEWHRQYSYQGLGVDLESVDMVYIDGLHDYWSVYNDIKIAQQVIKKGGWFAGHDYVKENPPVNTDVPRAVLDVFGREPEKVFEDTSWIMRNE